MAALLAAAGEPGMILDTSAEGDPFTPIIRIRAKSLWGVPLKAEGQSIVLVEQNLKLALELADSVAILNTGRIVFTGGVAELERDQELVTQHLGVF